MLEVWTPQKILIIMIRDAMNADEISSHCNLFWTAINPIFLGWAVVTLKALG